MQKNYLKYQGMSVSCETMTCIQLHNHYGRWTEWSAVWSVMGVLKIKQVFSKSLIFITSIITSANKWSAQVCPMVV